MIGFLSRLLYVIKEKRSQLVLMILIFLSGSLLDTVGIGLVGPFMGLANSPNIILENSFLNSIYTQL